MAVCLYTHGEASKRKGKSRGLVGGVFAGERASLEVFQHVLNGLLPHQLSKRHARVVDSRENLPKFIPGVFKNGAGTDDVIAGLMGGGVVVGGLARALEELPWLVLVLEHGILEVLPCWRVVSTHLGETGHSGACDRLEPLGGFGLHESGGLPSVGKGFETTFLLEDFLVLVFEVVEVGVPLLECK